MSKGPFLRAEWLEAFKDGAADQLSSSTAMHALEGCITGLTPTAAQTHVTPGEAYVSGNRLRLRTNRAIDLAGPYPSHRQPGGLGDRACQLHN